MKLTPTQIGNPDARQNTMTDSGKLRLLADWFDCRQPKEPTWRGTEVQEDLRRIADDLAAQGE